MPADSWTETSELAAVLGHREIAAPPPQLGSYPAVVHAPSISGRPILVDLTGMISCGEATMTDSVPTGTR